MAWLLLLLSPGRGRDPLPEEPSSRAWRKGQRAQKHLGEQAWPHPPAHEHLTALCAAAPAGTGFSVKLSHGFPRSPLWRVLCPGKLVPCLLLSGQSVLLQGPRP